MSTGPFSSVPQCVPTTELDVRASDCLVEHIQRSGLAFGLWVYEISYKWWGQDSSGQTPVGLAMLCFVIAKHLSCSWLGGSAHRWPRGGNITAVAWTAREQVRCFIHSNLIIIHNLPKINNRQVIIMLDQVAERSFKIAAKELSAEFKSILTSSREQKCWAIELTRQRETQLLHTKWVPLDLMFLFVKF